MQITITLKHTMNRYKLTYGYTRSTGERYDLRTRRYDSRYEATEDAKQLRADGYETWLVDEMTGKAIEEDDQ